jgi:hypothetical protein
MNGLNIRKGAPMHAVEIFPKHKLFEMPYTHTEYIHGTRAPWIFVSRCSGSRYVRFRCRADYFFGL